mmetsp:Transcript_17921/g.25104  ORF Transcript_17921/g.25104 Transcript_17921/m.25104 type:complete len:85 (+) Transcript_17921:1080-1334(+)
MELKEQFDEASRIAVDDSNKLASIFVRKNDCVSVRGGNDADGHMRNKKKKKASSMHSGYGLRVFPTDSEHKKRTARFNNASGRR